jgi:hypothetical protein
VSSAYCSEDTVRDRFHLYTVIPDEPDSCWLWVGSKRPRKYGGHAGQLGTGYGVEIAHRLSYRLHHPDRPIPADLQGMWITQRCGNSLCVNPAHLTIRPRPRKPPRVPKGRPVGEQRSDTRYTNDEIHDIKARIRAGEKLITIARRYGTAQSHISAIKSGRVYRTIE